MQGGCYGQETIIGGQIQWVLLERIGRPRIVDGKEIRPLLLKQSIARSFEITDEELRN